MRAIRAGDTGPEVHDVQRRLLALGYASGDDRGRFGPATDSALRAFQRSRGLVADGIVGHDTWRAIVDAGWTLGDRLLYHGRPMKRGDDVRELQRRLGRLGFDPGREDGVFGAGTARSVTEFQVNAGLKVDGIAGPASIAALRRLHRQHQLEHAMVVREREVLRAPGRASVAGARILVDPGHGPDDPGVEAADGAAEHEVTWELAARIAARLGARGATTVLARGPRTTPNDAARARLANVEDVDAILSIHCNGLASERARGAAAYYFGRDGLVSEAGRWLANAAVDAVCAATGTPSCRAHPSSTQLLRESRAPAVIVEPGFLTHPVEGRLLRDPDHQNLVAEALTDAVGAFLTRAPTYASPPTTLSA